MCFNEITTPAYNYALQLMFSQKPISEGMRELDSVVRTLAPHSIWDKFSKIDFEEELVELIDWVGKELASHQEQVAVLWFCLSDVGDEMELIYVREKRKPKSDLDWGAFDDGLWSKVPSTILPKMYEIADSELSDGKGGYTNSDVQWIIECCFPLAYAGLMVGAIFRELPIEIILGKDTRRRVAVFFAEGDNFPFGEITSQGFTYSKAPEPVS